MTKVQAFDFSSNGTLEEVVVFVSDPKLISNLEARIGAFVVGTYESDGNDASSTDSTRFSVPINSDLVVKAQRESQEFSLWASPSELAAPDLKVNIGVQSLTVDGQKTKIEKAPIEYRFGVLIRDSNWDGVDTYRIPALARTNAGTLIAAYDARYDDARDLPANIDVAYSRSFDGGKSWEPMRLALDFKGEDEAKEGVGDPSILVDPKTGRIWIAALWAHNGKSLAQSEPGLKLETSGQLVLTYSDDDGATWSEPRNITAEVASGKNWRVLFQGPGSGIVTRKGTLIFPAQFLDENRGFFSTIVWSDDQ
ncbi:MAG: exo-alpha-sialidase [Thermoguttaceae bacterium]|nr:exo-alpha-sialidase [Thermoguttaceae bacterium]